MTKELSKQLCELCEIEGKIKKQELTIVNGEIIDKFEYRIYPDFGKPNNFVKLYELDVEETIPISFAEMAGTCSSRGEFLNTVYILVLENEKYRKAIKNTEWQY